MSYSKYNIDNCKCFIEYLSKSACLFYVLTLGDSIIQSRDCSLMLQMVKTQSVHEPYYVLGNGGNDASITRTWETDNI